MGQAPCVVVCLGCGVCAVLSHSCVYSTDHRPSTFGRTPQARCTQFPKVRGVNRETPSCRFFSQSGSTHREHLLAFLDDIHMVTRPERVGAARASIRIHGGKTKIWNQSGERPRICDVLERIAQQNNPRARVWRGLEVPTPQQGIKVLGTPLGHTDFVRQHLRDVSEEHERFLTRIPFVRDVQSAWLLLLHCAQARANFLLRAVRPEAVEEFATRHDRGLWWCLAQILGVNLDQCEVGMQEAATLPLVLGGLGLRSAIRTRYSAFWASWVDCIPWWMRDTPRLLHNWWFSWRGSGCRSQGFDRDHEFLTSLLEVSLVGRKTPTTGTRHVRARHPAARMAT